MDIGPIAIIFLIYAFGFGFLGLTLGKPKGKEALGWWLGFLLGIFGIVIIAIVEASPEATARRQLAIERAKAKVGNDL